MLGERFIDKVKDHMLPLITFIEEQSKQKNNSNDVNTFQLKVDKMRIEKLKEFSRSKKLDQKEKSSKDNLETWEYLIHEFQEPLLTSDKEQKAIEVNQQIRLAQRKTKSSSGSRVSLRESLTLNNSNFQGNTPCAKKFSKISNFGLPVINEAETSSPMSKKSDDNFNWIQNDPDNTVSSAKNIEVHNNKNSSDPKNKKVLLSRRSSKKLSIKHDVSKFGSLSKHAIKNNVAKNNPNYKIKTRNSDSPRVIDKKRNTKELESFTKSLVKSHTFNENSLIDKSCVYGNQNQSGSDGSSKKQVLLNINVQNSNSMFLNLNFSKTSFGGLGGTNNKCASPMNFNDKSVSPINFNLGHLQGLSNFTNSWVVPSPGNTPKNVDKSPQTGNFHKSSMGLQGCGFNNYTKEQVIYNILKLMFYLGYEHGLKKYIR